MPAATAGVSESGGELHFRGGRSAEVQFLVDGMPVSDQFSGGGNIDIALNSLQGFDVLTGGFDAEYGNAQSGIVNLVTKEGGRSYSGELRYSTDDYGAPDKQFFNFDALNIGFGGPLQWLADWTGGQRSTFYLSSEFRFEDGYLNTSEERPQRTYSLKGTDVDLFRLRDRQSNQYSGQGKVSYWMSPTMKLTMESLLSRRTWDIYHHSMSREGYWSEVQRHWWFEPLDSTYTYYNGPSHTPNEITEQSQLKFVWTHTLSTTVFYTAKLSRFRTFANSASGGKAPYEYDPIVNTGYLDPENRYFVVRGDHPRWEENESIQQTFRFDLTNQVNTQHQLKLGLDMDYHDLRRVRLFNPSPEDVDGNPSNRYHVFPWEGSAYLQDKMRYEGMIVNAGVRLDVFDPARPTFRSDNLRRSFQGYVPSGDALSDRLKWQLSPRLGMAYPISERDVLHFHYGRFFQLPQLRYLYEFTGDTNVPAGFTVGNPALDPETTVSYEVGVEHQISDNTAVDVTLFFKDIFGLTGTRALPDATGATADPPTTFFNQDYGSVRGFECTFTKRFSGFWSGSAIYTYQEARGSSSNEFAGTTVVNGDQDRPPLEEVPLDWDSPHSWVMNVGCSDPGVWRVNFDYQWASGTPYSPRFVNTRKIEAKLINSERLPHTEELNVNAQKLYKVYGREFTLFLEGRNLTNRENISNLGPGTYNAAAGNYDIYYTETQKNGNARSREEGLGGAYNLKDVGIGDKDVFVPLNDPRVFDPERNFRVGIALEW